jgi:hypothetical protein
VDLIPESLSSSRHAVESSCNLLNAPGKNDYGTESYVQVTRKRNALEELIPESSLVRDMSQGHPLGFKLDKAKCSVENATWTPTNMMLPSEVASRPAHADADADAASSWSCHRQFYGM